jgi:peroxiredoxin
VALAYKAAASPSDAWPRRITYLIGANGHIEQAIETKDPAGQAAAVLELVKSA